ncbi:MAG TPA: cupredoxin domain-containing protein [bacterium]|nr:cupredoxin domain-containing protein [bacterium]
MDNRAGLRGMRRRRARTIVVGGIAVLLASVLAGLAISGRMHGAWRPPGSPPQPRLIRMSLVDGALDPSVVLLEPGTVRFEVQNDGTAPRRFVVQGPDTLAHTEDLAPGASASLDVTLTETGRYRLQAVSPSGDVLSAGTLDIRQ